jgi:hypothetical protein
VLRRPNPTGWFRFTNGALVDGNLRKGVRCVFLPGRRDGSVSKDPQKNPTASHTYIRTNKKKERGVLEHGQATRIF